MLKYKNEVLRIEDVRISPMAQKVGTPFYCYSYQKITENYNEIKNATKGMDALICYAMKANSNQAVIKTLADLGAGADVVSLGELKRAEKVKIEPSKIVFSGVGKTKKEIDYAIKKEIFCVNVESKPELEMISQRAKALNKVAPVSIRINPGVDARTHEKISTGRAQDKFGIPHNEALNVFKYARELSNVQIRGVDTHIGSQITDLEPYKKTFGRLTEIINELKNDDFGIQHVNVGGGLGIDYGDNEQFIDVDSYIKLLQEYAPKWEAKIILEPGRYIVGSAGILVTKIVYIKEKEENKKFVIVDAAMNDLLRPTLYNAHHEIMPVILRAKKDNEKIIVDVVGPVCETGDYLAKEREIQKLNEGELIAIKNAGAYGAVQSSTYNSRLLVPEVMVKGDKFHVVRPRQTYKQLIELDSIPNWLK